MFRCAGSYVNEHFLISLHYLYIPILPLTYKWKEWGLTSFLRRALVAAPSFNSLLFWEHLSRPSEAMALEQYDARWIMIAPRFRACLHHFHSYWSHRPILCARGARRNNRNCVRKNARQFRVLWEAFVIPATHEKVLSVEDMISRDSFRQFTHVHHNRVFSSTILYLFSSPCALCLELPRVKSLRLTALNFVTRRRPVCKTSRYGNLCKYKTLGFSCLLII